MSGAKRNDKGTDGPLDFTAYLRRRAEPSDVDVSIGVDRALRHAQQGESLREAADQEEVRFALHAIEAALFAIDDIRELLEEACEVTLSARESSDEAARALFAERYDEVRLAIDPIANEAEYEGASLLSKKARALDIELGPKAHFSVSAYRLDIGEKGLDLPPPRDAFETAEEIEMALEKLDRALQRVDRAAESYCRDAQYLSGRLELQTQYATHA
ncbi:MAG: hypothetical protein AAGC95_16110 [Pseudomonadota bacterium]